MDAYVGYLRYAGGVRAMGLVCTVFACVCGAQEELAAAEVQPEQPDLAAEVQPEQPDLAVGVLAVCKSCESLREELVAARDAASRQEEALKVAAARLDRAEHAHDSLRDANGKLVDSYERLRRVYERRGTALASLTKRHEEVTLQRDHLREQCAGLNARVNDLVKQIELLQGQVERQAGRISQLEADKLLVEQEREVLDAALDDLRQHPPCHWALLAYDLTSSTRQDIRKLCPTETPIAEPEGGRHRTEEVQIADVPPGSTTPELARSLTDVGLLRQRAGDLDEAETYLAWANMILTSVEKRDARACAVASGNLGGLYLEKEAWEQAEGAYRNALADYRECLGDHHPRLADIQNRLAASLRGQKRYSEAEDAYVGAIKLYRETLGPSHPHLVAPVNNLARLYLDLRRYEDAATWLAYALRMVAESSDAAEYRSFIDQSVSRLYADCPEVANALVSSRTGGSLRVEGNGKVME